MKITLLHPSRGRPEKAFQTAKKWIETAGHDDVEYILSLDDSDTKLADYMSIYGIMFGSIVQRDNNSVVQATNEAAKISTGDILIYLSDDFDCPDNWAIQLLETVKDWQGPWILKVDDCLQPFDVMVMTIPIMNRAAYETLGYFWHPGYKSMFVDEDLIWTARRHGMLRKAEHLKFPHLHPSNGNAPNDQTYIRSAKNWDQGKAMFELRRGAGFPLGV